MEVCKGKSGTLLYNWRTLREGIVPTQHNVFAVNLQPFSPFIFILRFFSFTLLCFAPRKILDVAFYSLNYFKVTFSMRETCITLYLHRWWNIYNFSVAMCATTVR